jgi:hypothetical protein
MRGIRPRLGSTPVHQNFAGLKHPFRQPDMNERLPVSVIGGESVHQAFRTRAAGTVAGAESMAVPAAPPFLIAGVAPC